MRYLRRSMHQQQTRRPWFWPTVAFVGLAALLGLTIWVTGRNGATGTENALWQFILFGIGLGASFYFGRQSVSQAAADVVRPQARAAARRLTTLGRGIRGFGGVIDLSRDAAEELAERNQGSVPIQHVAHAYDVLYVQIEMQMRTVIDALEDWRQFDPEIVNHLNDGDNE